MGKATKHFSYLLPLFLLACSGTSQRPVSKAPLPQDTTSAQQATDTAISIVQTGDVVLRSGLGPDSYMLMQMNMRDKKYSHCGIVVVEAGYPFVYHCIGGEDNPALTMRRDSISRFFNKRFNSGFAIIRFDQDSANIGRVAAETIKYYKKAPLFDMDFDLATDDKLYCSELVYKVETAATADLNYIGTSATEGKKYVGIDDLYLSAHGRIIWKVAF